MSLLSNLRQNKFQTTAACLTVNFSLLNCENTVIKKMSSILPGSVTSLTVTDVSYIRARDPSILSWNLPRLAGIRVNLGEKMCEETTADVENEDKEENLRVYLRIKPGKDFSNLFEIPDVNTLICKVPPGSNIMRNVKEGDSVKKIYTFTKIFGPETNQVEIFNNIVKPKVLGFINGQDSTLMTYGASGSGKTFTLIGTGEEPGLIPRSLEYLFKTISNLSERARVKPLPTGGVSELDNMESKREKMLCKNLLNSFSSVMDKSQHVKTYQEMQKRLSNEPIAFLESDRDVTVEVWVSFAEIYNEHIYDLLQPELQRGQIRPKLKLGSLRGVHFIKDLTYISVLSGLEAYQVLQYGLHNLNYASTRINAHSSRSHCIFSVKLIQTRMLDDKNGSVHVSTFNFCDLAGSERSKKTLNVGDRMKESININSSLSVLGRCISAIREFQKKNDNKIIPFRESKLTQLFQRALSGSEDMAMIVNIYPSREMFDEGQHTLNFAAIAKDITLERSAPIIKPNKHNRFSLLVQGDVAPSKNLDLRDYEDENQHLRDLVAYLECELETQRNDMETEAKMNLDFVREGYHKLMDEQRILHEQQWKNYEKLLKKQHETEMQKMRVYYEQLLREKNDVIILDSSDDEAEDKDSVSNKDEALTELQDELAKCKQMLEVEKLEKENQAKKWLEIEKNLKDEIMELKKTQQDAISLYKKIQEEINQRDVELLKANEKIQELDSQVEAYYRQNIFESDDTELS